MSHNRRDVDLTNPINTVGKSDSPACDICEAVGEVEQDHDHRTDLCRGLLCASCNHLLAKFDRPVSEIDRFLQYLRFWSAQHAQGGGRSYTEYMRQMAPRYGKKGHGRWRPRNPQEAA